MIRKKTGFKELTLAVLCGAALVSVACGDDDAIDDGTAGSGGTTTAGSKTTGGSAGSKTTGGGAGEGGASAGADHGGSRANGGEPNGGVPGEGGAAGEGGVPVGGAGGADAGAGGASAGAGGEGGAPEVVLDTLKNGSFELGNPGGNTPPDSGTKLFPEWTNTATPDGASYVEWAANKSGSIRLTHYNAAAFVATTEQTVSPIANGTYSFSIWMKRGAANVFNSSLLFAKGFNAANEAEEKTAATDDAIGDDYIKVTLEGIVVSSGKVTVGVRTDALAGGWLNMDDAELTLTPE